MSTTYDGSSGPEQHAFIRNTEIGWKQLKRDSSKHAFEGVSQYEYVEDVTIKVSREARGVLDRYLHKWNWVEGRTPNPNIEMAIEREADRNLWRVYYNMKATWSRKMGNTTSNAAAPLPPAVEEPRDIDDFLDVLLENFEAADALNLQILTDFKHDPKETLNLLGTRFDIVASSLEKEKLMSSRLLAIALLQHLPLMIRANVEQQMKDQDKAKLKCKRATYQQRGTHGAGSTGRKGSASFRGRVQVGGRYSTSSCGGCVRRHHTLPYARSPQIPIGDFHSTRSEGAGER